ncbi:hypothetical protein BN946_scf185035.g9 [Trametes cinnabarina]|uniref:Uncharacterized protein n=1 Tax=Pycnoporus cinnabarinus TaxID=5643 RepID=A0A060S3Y1_PYCCI|nr:hypothetical protein BN946_scf185035.g9 [Trametes cinnabarina]
MVSADSELVIARREKGVGIGQTPPSGQQNAFAQAWFSSLGESTTAEAKSPDFSAEERQELEKIAGPLQKHQDMLREYATFWPTGPRKNAWTSGGKVPDRMREDYDPNEEAKKPKPMKAQQKSQAGGSSQV